jgi:hypothetical protein
MGGSQLEHQYPEGHWSSRAWLLQWFCRQNCCIALLSHLSGSQSPRRERPVAGTCSRCTDEQQVELSAHTTQFKTNIRLLCTIIGFSYPIANLGGCSQGCCVTLGGQRYRHNREVTTNLKNSLHVRICCQGTSARVDSHAHCHA